MLYLSFTQLTHEKLHILILVVAPPTNTGPETKIYKCVNIKYTQDFQYTKITDTQIIHKYGWAMYILSVQCVSLCAKRCVHYIFTQIYLKQLIRANSTNPHLYKSTNHIHTKHGSFFKFTSCIFLGANVNRDARGGATPSGGEPYALRGLL